MNMVQHKEGSGEGNDEKIQWESESDEIKMITTNRDEGVTKNVKKKWRKKMKKKKIKGHEYGAKRETDNDRRWRERNGEKIGG